MDRSEQIGDLVTALAKAQSEFKPATKDSNNPYYNSKYADLAAIIEAVRPALTKHGLALIQTCDSDLERQTASVTTSLHLGEQWISVTAEAPAKGKGKKEMDDNRAPDRFDVQTIGAAWTYLRRYTLQGLVAVPAEDDDGNALTGPNAPIPAKNKKKTAEEWQAASVNPFKDDPAAQAAAAAAPTTMEGNILTCTVTKINTGKTKQGKEYRSISIADPIAISGAPKPFDLIWCWHQGMWEDLRQMPGRECEFMVATSEKGITLNTILRIGSIEWTEPQHDAAPEPPAQA